MSLCPQFTSLNAKEWVFGKIVRKPGGGPINISVALKDGSYPIFEMERSRAPFAPSLFDEEKSSRTKLPYGQEVTAEFSSFWQDNVDSPVIDWLVENSVEIFGKLKTREIVEGALYGTSLKLATNPEYSDTLKYKLFLGVDEPFDLARCNVIRPYAGGDYKPADAPTIYQSWNMEQGAPEWSNIYALTPGSTVMSQLQITNLWVVNSNVYMGIRAASVCRIPPPPTKVYGYSGMKTAEGAGVKRSANGDVKEVEIDGSGVQQQQE